MQTFNTDFNAHFADSAAATPTVVAFGATAQENINHASVEIFKIGNPAIQRSYAVGVPVEGLAFGSDNRTLYAVNQSNTGDLKLFIIKDAATAATTISLSAPPHRAMTQGVTVSGQIAFTNLAYDGTARTVHVTRTDTAGAHSLPDVTSDTSGKFSFTDSATPRGRATYSVTYDGDSTHGPATGTTFVLREVPWDLNGDGMPISSSALLARRWARSTMPASST